MPGYKQLPHFLKGPVADKVRAARDIDQPDAIQMLEEALAACAAAGGPLPGWLCGRLAAQYRSVGRYDDEVNLLERYRSTQDDDVAVTRFDARLGKARILATRVGNNDNGALASIRDILGRPKPKRGSRVGRRAALPTGAIDEALRERLSQALADATLTDDVTLVETTLAVADLGRQTGTSVESLIAVLTDARRHALGFRTEESLEPVYNSTLRLMVSSFADESRGQCSM